MNTRTAISYEIFLAAAHRGTYTVISVLLCSKDKINVNLLGTGQGE